MSRLASDGRACGATAVLDMTCEATERDATNGRTASGSLRLLDARPVMSSAFRADLTDPRYTGKFD